MFEWIQLGDWLKWIESGDWLLWIETGGWLMWPILLCSVVATAIVLERFWTLHQRSLIPPSLIDEILALDHQGQLDFREIDRIRRGSALGRVLAAGLVNRRHSREVMKEAIQETGRQVVVRLERYLNTLGTIAAVTPLLGLLGTVVGMIEVFGVIVSAGVGDPGMLAGGIGKALMTTAAGLSVAIPALMFHRYFNGRVDKLAVSMEERALYLIEALQGEREFVEDFRL